MAIGGHWQALAQVLAERMLNSIAEGIVIALFGWLLLTALRRQNSSTRFAVLFSALATVAMLPMVDGIGSHTAVATSGVHSAFRLPGFWAVEAVVVWAAIAGVNLAKIGLGFWQLRRLRQGCAELDRASLHPDLLDALNKFGFGRRINLCTSDQVRVPTAIGFMKPAIIIPAWAMEELTPEELNTVVLHELAHLRRWDDWTNLAQRMVRAVLFFHPAVWWIGQGLAREREMACDDFVLAATSDRRAYAQCLVSVAEKSFLRRGLALAQAMVGRMQLTAQRVARILAVDRPAAIRVWKPALGLAAAFSTLCVMTLPHAPRLVAFDGAGAGVSASRLGADPVPAVDSPAVASSGLRPPNIGGKMIRAAFAAPPVSARVDRKDVARRSLSIEPQPTKFVQPEPGSVRVLNASADKANGNVSANAMCVVMQTEQVQVDEYGRIWSVYVWRLTVFHPADRAFDQAVRKGITPKST